MLVLSPVLQMSVGVLVILLTGWWILALASSESSTLFICASSRKNPTGLASVKCVGSNWWIALILGALLTLFGVIVILNPMLGLS